jgi:hypothetical protein
MRLVVHELLTGATDLQQIVTPDRNTIVEAIRPHLYRHNFASGSLKVQILDGSDVLLAESAAVAISSIDTANYFHGYVRFDVTAYLAKDTPYKVRLVNAGGYTFSEAAYVGWVNGYDLGKYPPSTVPANDQYYPLDLEIWERTVK